MCGSMVDIQSPTAEIRRGKKKEGRRRKKIETTAQKYNGLPYYIGRPKYFTCDLYFVTKLLLILETKEV